MFIGCIVISAQREKKPADLSVWKNSVWILYLFSFFSLCMGVPSYMSAISLLIQCVLIINHIYGVERKGLWLVGMVLEGLLFIYSYLNMFSAISSVIYPENFFNSHHLGKVEVGLFVTSDIVGAVSRCEVFFYFLPSFLRIVIGASRILYFTV